MSHVTHMNESCHTYEWVMSRIWMSHVTHMNESWHTYEWIMPHIWMSHVADVNESSHIWMRDVTYGYSRFQSWCSRLLRCVIESRHTHEWVMSHAWKCHVTHMNVSFRTPPNEARRTTTRVSHVTHMNESGHSWINQVGELLLEAAALVEFLQSQHAPQFTI